MKKFGKLIYLLLFIILLGGCFSSILKDKTNSSTNNDEKNSTSIVENVDFTELTYIAFGDSITKGYCNNAVMDTPYPKGVSEKLGLKSFTNLGISGADLVNSTLVNEIGLNMSISNQVLALDTYYDIISVNGGVNDWHYSQPLGTINDNNNSTIYGSLNVMANHLKTNFPNSFIFFITPYNFNKNGNDGYTINDGGYSLEDVSNAYKKIGIKYNIPILDLFHEGQYELEMYNSNSDGVHPTQEFVLKYSIPQITQFIKENYKK